MAIQKAVADAAQAELTVQDGLGFRVKAVVASDLVAEAVAAAKKHKCDLIRASHGRRHQAPAAGRL